MIIEEKKQIDEDRVPRINDALNIKVIKKGILAFIAISIISLLAVFLYTNTGKTFDVWSRIHWHYILIGVVFIIVDLFIGAWRNHIFVRHFKPSLPFIISVKANLANIFMGAVTPSQSGGGPAQVYIFHRHGLGLADNISISFFNWISTIIFFPLTGAAALYILKDDAPSGFVMHLTKFGFSAFTTLFIIVAVGLFSPQVLGKIITGLGTIFNLLSNKWGQKLSDLGKKAVVTMTDYQKKYIGLIKTKPQLMVYSFLLTILLYFNKYVLAYIILLAFGQEADFWTVIAIQAVLYLLLYFSPSPGGSGIAELSISALMASIIAADYVASFTLLYRSFLVFIPALLGAFVVLRQISKE